MASKNRQFKMLKEAPKAYGGSLLNTRKGRQGPRPLDTKNTIHLILRSSKATGDQCFWLAENRTKIKDLTAKFSRRFGVKICSMANVGNHLHFQIHLTNRFTYKPFIRALTAAIAMAVSNSSRWNPMRHPGETRSIEKRFWDERPFTRVVKGYRAYLNLKDYMAINQMEGFGLKRAQGKFFLSWNDLKYSDPSPI